MKIPWIDKADEYQGKKESDSTFSRFLSVFWAIVGLPGYTSIAGNSRAWCGLFVAAMLSITGYNYHESGASAKRWMKYGQAIDWKVNGIPRGAIVQINHKFKCGSGSGNHVAFANGYCSAEDLLKSDATIDLFGGNQNNMAQVSTYSVKEICAVRWPDKEKDGTPVPLPEKVLTSLKCTSGKAKKESTT